MDPKLDSRIHGILLRQIIDRGYAPPLDSLAKLARVETDEARRALERLAAGHGVVLHPGTHEAWIAHPFSLSPTHVWVANRTRGWWAPCVWCALGISALVGGDTEIRTTLGAEGKQISIYLSDGEVMEKDLLVHYAIRPEQAWENVVHFCSTVLPFRHEKDVDDWCERHRIPKGALAPISQINRLAREWYGGHLSETWRKWSVAQAREIFQRVGLTGAFWELSEREGTY